MPAQQTSLDQSMSALGSGSTTIADWLRQQGLQDSDNFNGGRRTIDPTNPSGDYYDQVAGGMYSGASYNYDFRQLPGYEAFFTPGNPSPGGDYDPIPDKFDWAGWSAANPGYKLESGNLGGRSGTIDFVTGPNGELIGNPTFNRNTALSDARNIALVVAGGYLGGTYAFGEGAAGAGATSAADASALDSAMIDMGAGATNTTAAGGAGAEATAATAGTEAAATSGGEAATTSGSSEFNPDGFNGREPTNPSFAQSGNGYSGYGANGQPSSGGYNWDQIIRGGLGLWQAYRLSQMGEGGGASPASRAANEELTRLLSDPSKIQDYPGYKAGLQAVERAGAGGGYLGSGNMMTALQDYGGNFYDRALQRLAGIVTPAEQTSAQYQMAATSLYGQSLNSLGYGLSGQGGGSGGSYYDALIALLGD